MYILIYCKAAHIRQLGNVGGLNNENGWAIVSHLSQALPAEVKHSFFSTVATTG